MAGYGMPLDSVLPRGDRRIGTPGQLACWAVCSERFCGPGLLCSVRGDDPVPPVTGYLCRYCRQRSALGQAPVSCPLCGAPLDVRPAVSGSGWMRHHPVPDQRDVCARRRIRAGRGGLDLFLAEGAAVDRPGHDADVPAAVPRPQPGHDGGARTWAYRGSGESRGRGYRAAAAARPAGLRPPGPVSVRDRDREVPVAAVWGFLRHDGGRARVPGGPLPAELDRGGAPGPGAAARIG